MDGWMKGSSSKGFSLRESEMFSGCGQNCESMKAEIAEMAE